MQRLFHSIRRLLQSDSFSFLLAESVDMWSTHRKPITVNFSRFVEPQLPPLHPSLRKNQLACLKIIKACGSFCYQSISFYLPNVLQFKSFKGQLWLKYREKTNTLFEVSLPNPVCEQLLKVKGYNLLTFYKSPLGEKSSATDP